MERKKLIKKVTKEVKKYTQKDLDKARVEGVQEERNKLFGSFQEEKRKIYATHQEEWNNYLEAHREDIDKAGDKGFGWGFFWGALISTIINLTQAYFYVYK